METVAEEKEETGGRNSPHLSVSSQGVDENHGKRGSRGEEKDAGLREEESLETLCLVELEAATSNGDITYTSNNNNNSLLMASSDIVAAKGSSSRDLIQAALTSANVDPVVCAAEGLPGALVENSWHSVVQQVHEEATPITAPFDLILRPAEMAPPRHVVISADICSLALAAPAATSLVVLEDNSEAVKQYHMPVIVSSSNPAAAVEGHDQVVGFSHQPQPSSSAGLMAGPPSWQRQSGRLHLPPYPFVRQLMYTGRAMFPRRPSIMHSFCGLTIEGRKSLSNEVVTTTGYDLPSSPNR